MELNLTFIEVKVLSFYSIFHTVKMTKILDQLFTKSQITLLVVQDVLSTFNDSPNSTKNAKTQMLRKFVIQDKMNHLKIHKNI